MNRDIRGEELQFGHPENGRFTTFSAAVQRRQAHFSALCKTMTIGQRADAIMSTKLQPQVFRASESGHACDVIRLGRISLQQDAGLLQPLPEDPLERW